MKNDIEIKPYIGNPVINDQKSYSEVFDFIKDLQGIEIILRPDHCRITYCGTRKFAYPKKPTVNWLLNKIKYATK